MRVSFFSNYLNHHQLPFCEAMSNLLGDDFRFIATTPFNESRLKNGYQDMNAMYDFVVRSYESPQQHEEAKRLAVCSDVMITGSAPEEYLFLRLRKNPKGITFKYSERLYKENNNEINYKNPFFYWNYLINKVISRKNLGLLAASAYAPPDYVRTGFHRDRIYKWGYFPSVSTLSAEALLQKKPARLQLIWVGRLIDWKHPEQAVEAARMLRDDRLDFQMKIIGAGPMEDTLQQMIRDYHLQDCVCCTGGLPSAQVREEMEKSHIHLFTSDYNEGWGAVLNESMASACAPVCSAAVGAAPFLIEQEKSGLMYPWQDTVQLYRAVRRLMESPELLRDIQENAHARIAEHWNAAVAAKNLLLLCEALAEGNVRSPISQGPCAQADTQVRAYEIHN